MNKYNPNIHHRKSIRLKGYDYSQKGMYFITICTQNRKHLFGEIPVRANIVRADLRVCPMRVCPNDSPIMQLNHAGTMVKKWYYELENKFNDIKCHEIIIMPNHIHFIIENVGADLRVCPNDSGEHAISGDSQNKSGEHPILGEHIGSPLRDILQWFKTMTTNEYIRGVKNGKYPRFEKRIWQRNYWEHIIRNENEYKRIAQYIIDNPKKWQSDRLNNGDGNVISEPQSTYNYKPWMV
ncbi:MAG: hypothetical protein N4A49_13235 [Marinifilaceae bacterium]|jgi:REP element-mobilizing transposase RayT|nr:hypothetical protein [Marinifilaceae bacterium]